MNKQELIEKLKSNKKNEEYNLKQGWGGVYTKGKAVSYHDALELAKQLDEPQKRVMPKFFDDWAKQVIERRDKFYAISLITRAGWGYGVDYELDENKSPSMTGELLNWLVESPTYLNKEKAVNALLYGYEVEKEPLYVMPVPHVSYPVHYCVEDDHISFRQGNAQKFTQAELDKYFPDIKQFAVPVEEVVQE